MPQPIYLPGPQPNPFLNFLNQAAMMMISHNLGMKRQEAYLEAQKDIAEIEKKYTLSLGGYTKEPPSTKKMSEEELDKAIAGKMQPIKVGTEAFWPPPAPELPESLQEDYGIVAGPGGQYQILKRDKPSFDEQIKRAFAAAGIFGFGGKTWKVGPSGEMEEFKKPMLIARYDANKQPYDFRWIQETDPIPPGWKPYEKPSMQVNIGKEMLGETLIKKSLDEGARDLKAINEPAGTFVDATGEYGDPGTVYYWDGKKLVPYSEAGEESGGGFFQRFTHKPHKVVKPMPPR